jgi:hypothetical protein
MSQEPSPLERVAQFFRNEQWVFSEDQEKRLIRAGFKGPNTAFHLFIRYIEFKGKGVLQFTVPQWAQVPASAPKESVLEYLMGVNYDLIVGAFGYDPEDGEINFSYSVPTENATLSPEQIRAVVYRVCAACDREFPHVMKKIWGSSAQLSPPPTSSPESPQA